jgi:hypothetical protein
MADHCHRHRRSRTSEVRDGTSWAQDNPVPLMYGARDYDAYGHRIHGGNEEVFVEQFARAMSAMVSRNRRVTNPDSRQLGREVRALIDCFTKQVESQAGVIASSSPLLVEQRAYSETAGHVQLPQHSERQEETDDRRTVQVVEGCLELMSDTAHRIEECRAEKLKDLAVARGRNGAPCTVNKPDQRKVESHQNLRNDIQRRLDKLSETAHQKDECCVEKLKDLASKQGNGATHAVSDSVQTWAQYEAQHKLKDNDTHRSSDGKRCRDDRRYLHSSKSSPAGRGGVGYLPTKRDLELVVVGEKGTVFKKPTRSEKLDMDASSRRGPDVKNNDTRCSMGKLVSKRRVAHTAPLPAISTRDSPRSPQPTRPHTLDGSSYGPQMAVTSIHPRFHRESRCRRLDGTELRQNDEACCPVRILVSNRRVAPTAPTPAASTRCPPRSQHPTHSKMRYNPSDGPQTAVPSAPTRPLDGPCSHRSERTKPCQDGTVIQERSNANVNAEKKLGTSSVAIRESTVELDLPSPVVKEPNKQVGLAELRRRHRRRPPLSSGLRGSVGCKYPAPDRWVRTQRTKNNTDTHRQDACRAGVPRHSPPSRERNPQ